LSAIRALAPDEVGPVELGLYVELRRAVDPLALVSLEDQLHHAAENEAPLWLVAEDEGRPVGYGFGSFWKGEPKDFMPASWGVLPEARGRGHGAALYAALAAHAGEHGASELQASADDVGRAWLERRGFRLIDTLEQIVLDVQDAPPAEPLPDGVELTTYLERPDLGRALHAIVEEGLQDIPGGLAQLGFPYESWRKPRGAEPPAGVSAHRARGRRAGRLRLAERLRRLVLQRLHRRGAPLRRRGLARTLKLAQIEDARRVGIERLITQSNEHNAAMRALNEELGYRPTKPLFVLRGFAASP